MKFDEKIGMFLYTDMMLDLTFQKTKINLTEKLRMRSQRTFIFMFNFIYLVSLIKATGYTTIVISL